MKVLELLLKKDLHPKVGVPKSTVADWIEDFSVYIPRITEGNRIYYRPETIDVLLFIKKCREQNYQKQQIYELLAKNDFPITVEDAVEDIESALNDGNNRDNLITVMQTMGQAVTEIANQKERLNEHDESLESLSQQQDGQNERIKNMETRTGETDETISYLKQEIESLKQELAATKEKEKKGFFARLFNK